MIDYYYLLPVIDQPSPLGTLLLYYILLLYSYYTHYYPVALSKKWFPSLIRCLYRSLLQLSKINMELSRSAYPALLVCALCQWNDPATHAADIWN